MLTKKILLCSLAALIIIQAFLPQEGSASDITNGCHCFRNRTFDPANSFASDDYLLTTTFNSLLASEFNISKRQIIMMKMREGIANQDLVTALYISRETDIALPDLLRMKKEASWHDILGRFQSGNNQPQSGSFHFITDEATEEEISTHITGLMISSRFAPAPDSLEELNKNGLNPREVILVYTLAGHSGAPVDGIVEKHRTSGLSWSEIAHNLGLEPAEVGKLLEKKKKGGK